jgi:hypothetical protein
MKTHEEFHSDLIDVLEPLDVADEEGKILGRQAIATLCEPVTAVLNAIAIAEGR